MRAKLEKSNARCSNEYSKHCLEFFAKIHKRPGASFRSNGKSGFRLER